MKNAIFAMFISFFGIGCHSFGTGETIAVVSVSSVAGVGLGYLGMYGVNRAAFASALSEHREALQNNSGQTHNVRGSLHDSDNDGVNDNEDVCFSVPRGPRPESSNANDLARWNFGCPVPVASPTS